jgi:hypothetical protein
VVAQVLGPKRGCIQLVEARRHLVAQGDPHPELTSLHLDELVRVVASATSLEAVKVAYTLPVRAMG